MEVVPSSVRFLVVLDADSTLIRNEVIELIADEAGLRSVDTSGAVGVGVGGGADPMGAYESFRGRAPSPGPMFRRRGLEARSSGSR